MQKQCLLLHPYRMSTTSNDLKSSNRIEWNVRTTSYKLIMNDSAINEQKYLHRKINLNLIELECGVRGEHPPKQISIQMKSNKCLLRNTFPPVRRCDKNERIYDDYIYKYQISRISWINTFYSKIHQIFQSIIFAEIKSALMRCCFVFYIRQCWFCLQFHVIHAMSTNRKYAVFVKSIAQYIHACIAEQSILNRSI